MGHSVHSLSSANTHKTLTGTRLLLLATYRQFTQLIPFLLLRASVTASAPARHCLATHKERHKETRWPQYFIYGQTTADMMRLEHGLCQFKQGLMVNLHPNSAVREITRALQLT